MDFCTMARDPRHRWLFEKLLLLAAHRGDADLVAERLACGIDPNCVTKRGRTPLILNIRGGCPKAVIVNALLRAGADANALDHLGLSALDHARRKLIKASLRPRRRKSSSSLDENGQVQLLDFEQTGLDNARQELGPDLGAEFVRTYFQERRRAALRVFNDPAEIEAIVDILEGHSQSRW